MGIALFKNARDAKKEVATSAFVPYSSHATETMIRLESGAYIQILKLQGAAHESADPIDINSWHNQLNNCLRNIHSTELAVWSHVVRREFCQFPGGEFKNTFCAELNRKYAAKFESQQELETGDRMLVNELYVTLVYRSKETAVGDIFGKFKKPEVAAITEQHDKDIETLKDYTSTALAELHRYEPRLLSLYESNGILFSEMEEFLAFLVNGEWSQQAVTSGPISGALCRSRPYFGKGGLLTFKRPAGHTYAAALVIQQYPTPTHPGLTNDLLSAPYEFVLTQSFAFMSTPTALRSMAAQKGRLINAGDVATSQIAAIEDAMDALQNNEFVMGTHHFTLVVKAQDQARLAENISDAGQCMSSSGMKWGREDIALAGCFWSQLPGNFSYRVRSAHINSKNFAGFSSFHNYPTGRIRGAQWGDAVTMLKTTSGAPYYFNFHKVDEDPNARFNPDHKELANWVAIGKPGTGKTVIAGFMNAQAQKFHQPELGRPLATVLFDKDYGMSVAVPAMGGLYLALKNGLPTGIQCMARAATPGNINFLERFIKLLLVGSGPALAAMQERELRDAISQVMASPMEDRKLEGLLEYFNPSEKDGIYHRLLKWCDPAANGWLFNNPENTLDINNTNMIGFDVTDFLDNDEIRSPIMMYLFNLVDQLLDGRRVHIIIDEFWKPFKDPVFANEVADKLVTIRKMDGFLGMLTQNPKQIIGNPLAFAVVSATATKIFLPNPEADRADYVDGFKLTEAEYQLVKSLGERSRRFLIKQGGNSVVAELNFKPFKLATGEVINFDNELAVLSGTTRNAAICEEVRAEYGDNPDIWLPEFHRRRIADHIAGEAK